MSKTIEPIKLTGQTIWERPDHSYVGTIYATDGEIVKPKHSAHQQLLAETDDQGRKRQPREVDVIYFDDGESTIVNVTITRALVQACGRFESDWIGAVIKITATEHMITKKDKQGREHQELQHHRDRCEVLSAPNSRKPLLEGGE